MKKAIILFMMLVMSMPTMEVLAQNVPTKRCEATTKKGTRCKNKAVGNTKYCKVHQTKSQSVKQCKAITKSGERCSRAAKTSGYCTQHYNKIVQK